jgi:hypothetical protein
MKVKHRVRAAELKSLSVRDRLGLILDLTEYAERVGLPLLIEVGFPFSKYPRRWRDEATNATKD